jgi:hypothetical protein
VSLYLLTISFSSLALARVIQTKDSPIAFKSSIAESAHTILTICQVLNRAASASVARVA